MRPDAEPPAPPRDKKDDMLPGDIYWDAVRQYPSEDQRAFVLSGSAVVIYGGTKLEADNIVIFRKTREVYAEGNIRLRVGESEISAENAYVDFQHNVGYMIDATVRVSVQADALANLGAQPSKAEQKETRREQLRQLDERPLVSSLARRRDPYGIYLDRPDDPQARANLIFRADKLIQNSRMHFSAEDAFVTSDDMAHPLYGVKAGKLDFFMKEVPDPEQPGKSSVKPSRIVAKGGRLQVLGLTLFPFPTITYDLLSRNAFYTIHSGSSKRWGQFGLFRFGYGLGTDEDRLFDPTHVYLDADERWKRGPAAGFEFDWQTGRRPQECEGERAPRFERGVGHLQVYALDEFQIDDEDAIIRARRDLERRIQPKIDGLQRRRFDANLLFMARRRVDNAGPPSFDIDVHEDEFRGLVDFAQHQPLKRFAGIDGLQMDLKYQRQTDRDFRLEYFQNNYMTQNQPEALASLRKAGDNYSMELLYRGNPQDFDGAPPRSPVDYGTFTGYEPALTYSLTPTPIYGGFLVTGELQAARMTRDFERVIYDQAGFEAGRAYAIVDVARPFKIGCVNIVPHVGTQQAGYTDSRDGGGTVQGAATYGVDLTTRFYGTFPDLENDALALTGMRHIIEPRISYRGVSGTEEEPVDVLDFDYIDDLRSMDKITLALDQTFQTRRPARDGSGMRTANFAGLDISIDYFPADRDQERLLTANALDLLRVDGYVRVLDVLKIDAALGLNLEDGQIETAAYGFTIDPQTRWRLRFEERFNFKNRDRRIFGSDQFSVKFEYQLSERWGFALERVQERRQSLLHQNGRQLERISVTRRYGAVNATFTYSTDRSINERSYFLTVHPVLVYRNLVVPSTDLLVASGEVSGDETEAPEERNFDPFELLKRRKTKGGDTKVRSRSMPPPPPLPRENEDVPTPPPPGSELQKGGADKRAGIFEDPNKPRRAPRVDQDDWTTPPATPASAR